MMREIRTRTRTRPMPAAVMTSPVVTPAPSAVVLTPEKRSPSQTGAHRPVPPGAYTVGYGKPPQHSRFRKGRSGNPRGRPKGAKTLQALIDRELDGKVVISEGGRRRAVTKREAVVKRVVNKALAGDDRATQTLLKHELDQGRARDPLAGAVSGAAGNDQDAATDRAILEAFRAQLLEKPEEMDDETKCSEGEGAA